MTIIKGVLLQWFTIFFFDKKSSDGAATHGSSEMTAMRDTQDKSAIENKTMANQE